MRIKVTIEEGRLDALWGVAVLLVQASGPAQGVEKIECVRAYVQHFVDVGIGGDSKIEL